MKNLTKQEIILLENLEKTPLSLEELMEKTKLTKDQIFRASLWLKNKGLLMEKVEEKENLEKTALLEEYLKNGFPEERIFEKIKQGVKKIEDLKKGFDKKEFVAGLGVLIKEGVVEKKGDEIILKRDVFVSPVRELLKDVEKNKKILIKRGFVKKVKEKKFFYWLGEKGIKEKENLKRYDFLEENTKEVIIEEKWKKKEFRPYDVVSPVKRRWGGRKHPLKKVVDIVREIFRDMGFKEMKGPWVEIAFWNMDAMFIPQDHPARDVQDTFYIDGEGTLPEGDLVKKVRDVQEKGGSCESRGYGFGWDESIAKKLLLRTHTTAVTYRTFFKKIKPPAKYFGIDRVFRNETIDKTHLPEFHQIEGFVADEGLTLRDLFGYIKEFYSRIGLTRLRFKPVYNPYTEPSAEVFVYHKKFGEYIEIANSGIFRPEALEPFGITVPVIAWGLALERLAMLLYDLEDIRLLLGHNCDVEWIRNYMIKRRF